MYIHTYMHMIRNPKTPSEIFDDTIDLAKFKVRLGPTARALRYLEVQVLLSLSLV